MKLIMLIFVFLCMGCNKSTTTPASSIEERLQAEEPGLIRIERTVVSIKPIENHLWVWVFFEENGEARLFYIKNDCSFYIGKKQKITYIDFEAPRYFSEIEKIELCE